MKVNDHFHDYLFDWNSRFYMIVGSYGSSKSYNTALKLVLKAVEEPNRKILVCRQVFRTLKESCYEVIKEIIYNLGLEKTCRFRTSPLSIDFVNGSRFVFLGLDDPMKLKSIHGFSIIWAEEGSECSYDSFKELNGRLRTKEQSMHIIISTNPVSKSSWVYHHFFKNVGVEDERLYNERSFVVDDTFYHHSTVDDNAFVPASYIEQLDNLKLHDPDLYRVARLGKFGQIGERVFHNVSWKDNEEVMKEVKNIPSHDLYDGLDFGFKVSYNAFVRCAVNKADNILYVYEEFYNKELINSELTEKLQYLKGKYHSIIGDSSRPELIEEIKRTGIRIKSSKKGAGSRMEGIQKIKSFLQVVVSSDCKNTFMDLNEWTYKKDKDGTVIEDQFSYDAHSVDAIYYAIEDIKRNKKPRILERIF
ncbi:MAG: PBSX family phage terminase large subunit [Fusobacteriaceae bacterium]